MEHLIRVLNDDVQERLEDDVLCKCHFICYLKACAYSVFTARTSGLFIDTPSNFSSVSLDDKHTLVKTTVHAFRGRFE